MPASDVKQKYKGRTNIYDRFRSIERDHAQDTNTFEINHKTSGQLLEQSYLY